MLDLIIDASSSAESVLDKKEKELLDLSLGRTKPKDKYQTELLAEIKEIESKGHSVDIPNN